MTMQNDNFKHKIKCHNDFVISIYTSYMGNTTDTDEKSIERVEQTTVNKPSVNQGILRK